MKPNLEALKLVNNNLLAYRDYTYKYVKKVGDEDKTPEEFKEWDISTFYTTRSLFFNLITGEPDFDKFYDSFSAPAAPRGKPIAWGPRFIPDLMDDAIWSKELSVDQKVKEIQTLYAKCKKIRQAFNRKKSVGKK